jgi:hypothetical protein
MAESKYGKYIIYEPKRNVKMPAFRGGAKGAPGDVKGKTTHMMYMDGEVIEGAFYSECAWFWPGSGIDQAPKESRPKPPPGGAHTHPFDEVVAFLGTNPDDPSDLCGEIEMWLEDEKHLLTKSFMIYIPAGMKHCPLIIRRVDKPIFHFTLGPGKMYA